MDLKNFTKHIKNNQLGPAYLFTGGDKYLIETTINELKKKYLNPATIEFNYNQYDSEDLNTGAVLNTLNMLPVMGEKRLVVAGEGFIESLDDQSLNGLEEYLKNPLSSTIFIIVNEKPDKRRKGYKLLTKFGDSVDFSKLDRRSLATFINNTLKAGGVLADRNTINYLIDRTHYLDSEEMDTMRIKKILESVNDYILEGRLTRQIIDEVVPETVEDNVFNIMDLIVRGKLQGVYPILDNFWLQGESPIGIFSLLTYQLRNILKIKLAMEKTSNQNEIAKLTGLRPFIVRKNIPIARSYSLSRLYELYKQAGDLDFDIKMGNIDAQEGLEYYLLKLHKRK